LKSNFIFIESILLDNINILHFNNEHETSRPEHTGRTPKCASWTRQRGVTGTATDVDCAGLAQGLP